MTYALYPAGPKQVDPTVTGAFNVLAYGAVHDGVTDDTAAINLAIAAANLVGGTVYCPGGHYRINGQLTTLGAGVWLRGQIGDSARTMGTIFETYRTDTVLYLCESTGNVSQWNGVSSITWQCMVPTSDASFSFDKTITGASNATPIQITAVAHGFSTNDQIEVTGVLGNTAANNAQNLPWTIIVIDADHFSLTGSTGNGVWAAGGTQKAWSQTKFDHSSNAAIEGRGLTYGFIEDCKFFDYCNGIVLDGAELCEVSRCVFFGTGNPPGPTGYADLFKHGRGIWLTDFDPATVFRGRGRGWTVPGSVNGNTIRNCGLSGGISIELNGGLVNFIQDCNFQGGVTGIRVLGTNQLVIDRPFFESGSPGPGLIYKSEQICFNNVIQVTISNGIIAAASPNGAINCVGPLSLLNLFNNQISGATSCIKGGSQINACTSLNNACFQAGVPLFDTLPLGGCIGINWDGNGIGYGLSINRGNPARAILDGRIIDNTKAMIRISDANYDRWILSSSDEQNHMVERRMVSPLTGENVCGDVEVLGRIEMAAGAVAANVCPYLFPDNTLSLVTFTVVQWENNDPTRYGIWERRARVSRLNGGAITISAITDLVAPEVTSTITAPILVDDGSGHLSVQINSNAGVYTRAQVDVRHRAPRR